MKNVRNIITVIHCLVAIAPSKESSGKKKKESGKKSLFIVKLVDDIKLFFLRLFKKCFTNNLGPESFSSFMSIIKKENSFILVEDKMVLNLVLKKCFKLRTETAKIFVANMLDIFKDSINLKIFFEADLSIEFLDFCYQNSQNSKKIILLL
jgi:hypothetical protein